jgi:hypothetical protein
MYSSSSSIVLSIYRRILRITLRISEDHLRSLVTSRARREIENSRNLTTKSREWYDKVLELEIYADNIEVGDSTITPSSTFINKILTPRCLVLTATELSKQRFLETECETNSGSSRLAFILDEFGDTSPRQTQDFKSGP